MNELLGHFKNSKSNSALSLRVPKRSFALSLRNLQVLYQYISNIIFKHPSIECDHDFAELLPLLEQKIHDAHDTFAKIHVDIITSSLTPYLA